MDKKPSYCEEVQNWIIEGSDLRLSIQKSAKYRAHISLCNTCSTVYQIQSEASTAMQQRTAVQIEADTTILQNLKADLQGRYSRKKEHYGLFSSPAFKRNVKPVFALAMMLMLIFSLSLFKDTMFVTNDHGSYGIDTVALHHNFGNVAHKLGKLNTQNRGIPVGNDSLWPQAGTFIRQF